MLWLCVAIGIARPIHSYGNVNLQAGLYWGAVVGVLSVTQQAYLKSVSYCSCNSSAVALWVGVYWGAFTDVGRGPSNHKTEATSYSSCNTTA